MRHISRRDFLKTGALAAGLTIVPNSVLGKTHGFTSPSDKLNIAGVGVGGMGRGNLRNMSTENIVALCDVDMGAKHTQKVIGMYPKAKQFRDFRQMFDKAGKEFDAVAIATPDHSHFPISMLALASGKHVYVEKPLARTFYEAELLMQAALKRPNLATQVGNQGHSEASAVGFRWYTDCSKP